MDTDQPPPTGWVALYRITSGVFNEKLVVYNDTAHLEEQIEARDAIKGILPYVLPYKCAILDSDAATVANALEDLWELSMLHACNCALDVCSGEWPTRRNGLATMEVLLEAAIQTYHLHGGEVITWRNVMKPLQNRGYRQERLWQLCNWIAHYGLPDSSLDTFCNQFVEYCNLHTVPSEFDRVLEIHTRHAMLEHIIYRTARTDGAHPDQRPIIISPRSKEDTT